MKLRAAFSLAVAAVYAATAWSFAKLVALRFAGANWFDIVRNGVALLLLLAGFIVFGRLFQHERKPVREMGWWWREASGDRRYFWQRKGGAARLGLAVGWGMAVLLVAPLALTGNLYPLTDFSAGAFGLTLLALGGWLLGLAARETIFRGYPFQRLVELAGPTAATLLVAICFSLIQYRATGESRGELIFTMIEQTVLCVALLRTRSLWFSTAIAWGMRAGVVALFGLPLPGVNSLGIVQSVASGPVWLTGGDNGPAASALAPVVAFLALVVVFRLTERDAIAEIRGAGYPVDLDANRAPNPTHAAYNDPPPVPLVQILPVAGESPVPPRSSPPED